MTAAVTETVTPHDQDPWDGLDATPTRPRGREPWEIDAAATAPEQSAPPAPAKPTNSGPASRSKANKPPEFHFTTRPLTGKAGWPTIMIEGEEYSEKSTLAIRAAADKRIDEAYILPIGEDVDWLGALPGGDKVRLIEHDGTWQQIYAAVKHVAALAEAAAAEGRVILLIIDSMTKLWQMLTEWAENRAMSTEENRKRLLGNPNEEIVINHTFWNASNRRHTKLMTQLQTMPAFVIMTARGKWVTDFDENTGRPRKAGGRAAPKVYSVTAHKEIGYYTTAWVRVSRDGYPQVVGMRLPQEAGGIEYGKDQPVIIDPRQERFAKIRELGWTGFEAPWLAFDVMKFDPATAQAPQVSPTRAGDAPDRRVTPTRPPVQPVEQPQGATEGPALVGEEILAPNGA